LALGDWAIGLARGLEDSVAATRTRLFEPVIRLGVTGLSGAGKTVFITALVDGLLNRGRMQHLSAVESGAIRMAYLQPQPDDLVPRFDFEKHLLALTSEPAQWPDSTRSISQLRVSLKIQPTGLLAGLAGPRTVHLDIVDYPGEWLLDLPMMAQTYQQWSDAALVLARNQARADVATDWLGHLATIDGAADFSDAQAQALAGSFTDYLHAARQAGFSGCAPGRFLLPGDLHGSPALTFAPLDSVEKPRRKSLYRQMARRFDAYKTHVVSPFFRDHFSRIDRQIVLLDALGAIHQGPAGVDDMRAAMGDILAAFRPGRNSWRSALMGRRVEKILFAATKADHIHHVQHPQLAAIVETMLQGARDRAGFSGAQTTAMSLASVRATVEETLTHKGRKLDCVRGILQDSGKVVQMYAGALPDDPLQVLNRAHQGTARWLDGDFHLMQFAPPKAHRRPGAGLAHIRLDKAAEFLLGDRLR